MKKDILTAFERVVRTAAASGLHALDFYDICRCIGVSPVSMNELLVKELGTDSEEIMDIYFGNAL